MTICNVATLTKTLKDSKVKTCQQVDGEVGE